MKKALRDTFRFSEPSASPIAVFRITEGWVVVRETLSFWIPPTTIV